MQSFNIVRTTKAEHSFRVASVMGRFDLQSCDIEERFKGEIDLPINWNIGLIVGNSGTGKSTIAKELFPNSFHTKYLHSGKPIIDDFPTDVDLTRIVANLTAVGFSSPKSWLKPYHVLSNGEKMRVDLAHALLAPNDIILFDEFTSVVDRNVARVSSFAVQKIIRKQQKKFIAVTCHHDVEDWLLPDWTFNTDKMEFLINSKKKDLTSNLKSLKQKKNQNIGKCLLSTTI